MNFKGIILLTATCIIGTTFSVLAQAERYVTVSLSAGPIATNNIGSTTYDLGGTNTITIAEGEAGELITCGTAIGMNQTAYATVTKDGVTIGAQSPSSMVPNGAPGSRGTTVAGPAIFSIVANSSANQSPTPIKGLMTVRITPLTFAADKTVLVSPGMGNVEIKMESSTNLNQWTDATNGVYADDMRFFRIKLTKVN